jgi:hypothetical protein
LYYEQLYHDIAQVGASCQTLDVTDASADGLSMDFKVPPPANIPTPPPDPGR